MLSFILCMVLIAAAALFTTGCNDTSSDSGEADGGVLTDGATLGTGENKFTFTAVDLDGNEITVTINTDKTFVGEALTDLGIISGEQGPYGLYIKTVNGITLDYDTDGKYWAFYTDGEYAMTGIDLTEIVPDTVYMLKPE